MSSYLKNILARLFTRRGQPKPKKLKYGLAYKKYETISYDEFIQDEIVICTYGRRHRIYLPFQVRGFYCQMFTRSDETLEWKHNIDYELINKEGVKLATGATITYLKNGMVVIDSDCYIDILFKQPCYCKATITGMLYTIMEN